MKMGRIFIPETTFTRQALPLERLLQGLAQVLQESQSGSNEADCRRQGDRRLCCVSPRAKTGCPGFKPWFYTTVNVGRYHHSEVNVRVEDGCVIIHARHEERDGEDFDVTETRRSVKLPKGVDEKRVVCFYRPDGKVLIKVPPAPATGNTETPKPNIEKPAKFDKTDRDVTTEEDVSDHDVDKRKVPHASSADKVNVGEPVILAAEIDVEVVEPITEGHSREDVIEARHQPSPVPSDDFSIIDGSYENTESQHDSIQRDGPGEEGSLDVTRELAPLADSVRVVEDGNQNWFEVSLNLKDFNAENTSVQLVDKELVISAKKAVTENGMYSLKEVHRRYPVPEAGILDSALAQITANGMVTVTVPLDTEPKDETRKVPIVNLE